MKYKMNIYNMEQIFSIQNKDTNSASYTINRITHRVEASGHMDMIVKYYLRPEALNPPSAGIMLWASAFDDYFQGT